jgi:hypothetical protein
LWISGGYEQNYKITRDKTNLLISQNIIQKEDAAELQALENRRFITAAQLGKAIREKIDLKGREEILPKISSSFISNGVPARLMTFLFTLITAVLSTWLIPVKE